MGDFRLTTGQIVALKALHRKQRDRRFADRLNTIILFGSGWSVADVASCCSTQILWHWRTERNFVNYAKLKKSERDNKINEIRKDVL